MSAIFVDSFTTALEDLKGRRAKDPVAVYDCILSQGGLISTFDVSNALAGTVTFLFRNEYLRNTEERGYPWVKCVPTDKGLKWRAGVEAGAKRE